MSKNLNDDKSNNNKEENFKKIIEDKDSNRQLTEINFNKEMNTNKIDKKLYKTNLDENGKEVVNENIFKNRNRDFKSQRKTYGTGGFFNNFEHSKKKIIKENDKNKEELVYNNYKTDRDFYKKRMRKGSAKNLYVRKIANFK